MGSDSDQPDLSTRVDRLERTLTAQQEALRALRAEVRRLRSAVSDAGEAAPPKAPTPPTDDDRDSAPAGEAPDGRGSPPSEGAPPRPRSERHRPATRLTSPPPAPCFRSRNDGAAGTASSPVRVAETAEPDDQSAVLDELVSWAGLRSEDWLNYAGIGLFLFGVVFLLQYSIQQGWLVPPVRVGFGAALGAGLLGTGLRLSPARQRLRQVLTGGSSGTFYATIFAAYQFYAMIAYPTAFVAMVGVTVGTVALAVRQDEPVLSVVGVLGGLGTPFLLYHGAGSLGGLALYTCLVLLGACAVYLARGWQSLLYTTIFGGWGVFLVTAVRSTMTDGLPPGAAAFQVGIGAAWLLLAGTPVLRAVLRRRAPDRWPVVPLARWVQPLTKGRRSAYTLVTVSPFLAFASTRLLWSAPESVWAVVAGGGAVIYTGAYVGLRRLPLPRYAPVHGLVAAVLAAYALSQALGGAALLVAWAVEAVLMLVLARRLDEFSFRVAGHALSAVVALSLAGRLLWGGTGTPPVVRPEALSELAAIALLGTASLFVPSRRLRWAYRGAALAGWLGWTGVEFWPLPNGPHILLLTWALTGAVMAAVAPRVADDRPLRRATHGLFAGVAGLFALLWADALDRPFALFPAVSRLLTLGVVLGAAQQAVALRTRTVYRGLVLVGWLAWLAAELFPVPNGGAYVLSTWALTGAGLAWGTPYFEEDASVVRPVVHGLYVLLGVGLALRFLEPEPSALPLLNVAALGELLVLGLAVAVSWVFERRPIRLLYRGAALAGWLGWTASQLAPVASGQAYTSLLWGGTAAALLVGGARLGRRPWQVGGLAVLASFVAKLFLVDLASLSPLWRIALFLGSGGAFLLISYLLPGLIPSAPESDAPPGS